MMDVTYDDDVLRLDNARLVKDFERWHFGTERWDPTNGAMKRAMEEAARAVEEQPEIIRQRVRANAKDFYKVEEFAQLAHRGTGKVRGWIARGSIESVRVAGKGPRGKLMIPGKELEKLFLGKLGVHVPPEVIDEELGQ